jgi:hypothetical protein
VSRRNDVFDQPRVLLDALGTFWSTTFGARGDLYAFLRGIAAGGRQASDDWRLLVEASSRKTCPLFAREEWFRLDLAEEDSVDARVARFDEGATFDDGALFDAPSLRRGVRFPLPENVVGISLLCNRIGSPSATLLEGVDYYVDADGTLVFAEDPFDSGLWASHTRTSEAGDDGAVVLELWAYGMRRDERILENQFGYVVGLAGASSAAYRDVLNAYYDCLVHGSGREYVHRLVASLCGVSLGEGNETVVAVETDAYGRFIATDQRVYRFAAGATPLVAVGDAVSRNQELVDAVRFYNFNRGDAPASLQALYLPAATLGPAYLHGLYFDNRDVDVEVVENDGATTDFSFTIDGHPGDVERFWAAVRDLEAERGYSLAELLDDRAAGNGPPSADHLPATVNPLEFLAANVFRYHLTVVVVKTSALGERTFGPNAASLLRDVFPPESAILVVFETTTTLASRGGATATVTPFSGMNASAGGSSAVATVRTKRTGSRCL